MNAEETAETLPVGTVFSGDNLALTASLADGTFQMVYLDPPFNTGRAQERHTMSLKRPSGEGPTRLGFGGREYEVTRGVLTSYDDSFGDYWAFLEPRLIEAWRLLDETGTLYLHLDYREVHYAKVTLDALFGRRSFLNEIIWVYDFGGRTKKRWPTKHDTILVYVKNPSRYYFNSEEVDREPYMAPGLVGPEKAALGKLPTDVWWHTIVSPTGREKTGYPTQKPVGIMRRMIAASTRKGDAVLDLFAGSGTTGAACLELDRRFTLVDSSEDAVATMRRRFAAQPVAFRDVGGSAAEA